MFTVSTESHSDGEAFVFFSFYKKCVLQLGFSFRHTVAKLELNKHPPPPALNEVSSSSSASRLYASGVLAGLAVPTSVCILALSRAIL